MIGSGLLIVVPARSASKGLPRKNRLTLGGLPLLAWTAEAICRAGLEGATCVLSTDDPDIAEIGRTIGLDAPFLRPAELATDVASEVAVALHAEDWVRANRDVQIDNIMWLQPTSPFRRVEALEASTRTLASDATVDAVIGVKSILRSLSTLFYADQHFHLSPVTQQIEESHRRQAMQPLLTPNGALYLIRANVLRTERTFFPAKTTGIEMNQIESIDIDDPIDFIIADAIARSGNTWRHRLTAS